MNMALPEVFIQAVLYYVALPMERLRDCLLKFPTFPEHYKHCSVAGLLLFRLIRAVVVAQWLERQSTDLVVMGLNLLPGTWLRISNHPSQLRRVLIYIIYIRSLKEVNLYSWNESKNGYLGALPWEKQA